VPKPILEIENSMKKSTLIPTLAIATILLCNGCSGGAKKSTDSPGVPILATKVVATNVPVQIQPEPVGHVMAYSTVTVRSQIGGILSEVHFKEGDEVKSNAPLFTIDPRPMQAALEHDKAQLENATAQFNRDQKLFEAKIESQDQFDVSKANRDTLAATVQSDELNLSFTEIRAPVDGVAGSLQAYAGNIVKAPDDTLLTINQIHPIYVMFAVPEQYLPEIQKQMNDRTLKVQVAYENMTVQPPQGELTFVNNAVDETTGTIQLKATFSNDNNALWPGQFVQVVLTLSELTNAIVVPSQAIQTGQNSQFVYVVKPDQTAEERPVTIGITYEGETVVQKGLAAGETVVTDGQLRLKPGTKVNIKSSIEAASPSSAP
jgi:multidrug efflux system membrane fusion protein